MKDDDWLQKLVKVKDDYERQNEENQKLHREILKRNMRYQKNEQEYENKLALLQREMRVRKRQEKKADETNRVTIKVHKQDIDEHI